MPSLYTEIEIRAPRGVVWQSLIHKEEWLYWNTFLFDRAPGQPFVEGRSVLLSLRRARGDEETEFEAKITLLQPGCCLRWLATAPGFRNEQSFELQDIGAGWTKYIHRERFSGIFTRITWPLIRQDEQQGQKRMARELRHYVEHLVI